MKRRISYAVFLVSIVTLITGNGWMAFAKNIDPHNDDSQYAYGENAGWFNFEPGGDNGDGAEVALT